MINLVLCCLALQSFRHLPEFVLAVAADGRSYKPELFARVVAHLQQRAAIGPVLLADIDELNEKLQTATAKVDEDEVLFI